MTELEGRPENGELEIKVECLSCGRASILRADRTADLPLVRLTRRLRCSECGSRAVKAARVETPRDVARLIRARMRSRRT